MNSRSRLVKQPSLQRSLLIRGLTFSCLLAVLLETVISSPLYTTLGATLAASVAQAEDGGESGKSGAGKGGGKRTQINFEDQLVEGQAQKPELFYLLQQRNANFKRLIRLREDFLPEMRKTADDIQRKGTGR